MDIQLSVQALDDLDSIYLYGESSFGAERVASYLRDLQAQLDVLRDFPHIGQDADMDDLRIFRMRPYLAIYRVRDHISIERVLRETANLAAYLQRLKTEPDKP